MEETEPIVNLNKDIPDNYTNSYSNIPEAPAVADAENNKSEYAVFAETVLPRHQRRLNMSRPSFGISSKLKGLSRPSFHRPSKPNFSFKKKPMFISIAVFLVLLIVGGYLLSQSAKKSAASPKSDVKSQIPDAKSRQDIARNFDFPIKDSTGKDVTKIHYSIENAEIHDQIIVQGQKASAIAGKTFLVINLKLTNDYDKPIQLNTKDYIRLTRNNSTELLAADIHNDPVTIQPISTKYTRLGFAINEPDKNLQLHIGEINGDKTTIDIKF